MSDADGVVILAGGLGTRLRSVVDGVPKVLAEVGGRPFLEYLLAQLRSSGFRRVVFCSGYMAEAIEGHFGDGRRWDMELEYSVESEPRGTAGALKLAEPKLAGERWLVMNGDSLFDISLQELVEAHLLRPSLVTIALAEVENVGRYGRVTCAPDGTITAFAEKTDAVHSGLINSGLYIIERALLDLIPVDRPVSLERDVFPALVGGDVRGRAFDGYFIDIGVPEDYARARRDAETFDRLAALIPPR